ncbi:MAG: methyltransferase domain-containing protein [Sedimentisphaerales bacterium]
MKLLIKLLKSVLPESLYRFLSIQYVKFIYRYIRRPLRVLETSKAKPRRIRENFFEKYCQGKGLDVGYGGDPITKECRGWDIEDGDGQLLQGIEEGEFDFVYSSHLLEHMNNAKIAIKNWWRAVKPGGYLILYLPDRELYERKKTLPSRWNPEHKRFFLLDRDEHPDTVGVIPLIKRCLSGYEIIEAKICDEGYRIVSDDVQSEGEYSIEVVIKKKNG